MSSREAILVTGASGFVGRALCETLLASGRPVRRAYRIDRPGADPDADSVHVGEIGAQTDWTAALAGVDSVVHLAARAHAANEAEEPEAYFEVNERGTRQLAWSAARAGVRRLVFLSSAKVNGEETQQRAFTPTDIPDPQGPYATSKWHAERHLAEVAAQTGLETVIVRSPLVYGPGVRANFLRLMQLVDRQWPLPLASIRNRRSLVSVWNLCAMLLKALDAPAAAGRIWMVSDGEDLSTPQLLRRMALAMHRHVTLLPVPLFVLHSLGRVTGHHEEIARLCGSLALDITKTRSELGWKPPLSVDEGLGRTVEWYRGRRQATRG